MSLTNRSARSHRSTKVPNVKLRPASNLSVSEANRKSRREREAQTEDDSHFRSLHQHADEEEVDAVTYEKQLLASKKPLTGLTLAFTQVGDLKVSRAT